MDDYYFYRSQNSETGVRETSIGYATADEAIREAGKTLMRGIKVFGVYKVSAMKPVEKYVFPERIA
jgi:hypothetical protein